MALTVGQGLQAIAAVWLFAISPLAALAVTITKGSGRRRWRATCSSAGRG
jgi:hypothetical protein